MKINLPTPVVIGIVVLVVAVIGFFFIRGVTVEPPTPRPDPSSFGEKPAASGAASTGAAPSPGTTSYPGQSGSGAVTPINPSGG